MNGLGDEFLPDLSRGNKNSRIGWSHDRNLLKQSAQRGTTPDDTLNAGPASSSSESGSSSDTPSSLSRVVANQPAESGGIPGPRCTNSN